MRCSANPLNHVVNLLGGHADHEYRVAAPQESSLGVDSGRAVARFNKRLRDAVGIVTMHDSKNQALHVVNTGGHRASNPGTNCL